MEEESHRVRRWRVLTVLVFGLCVVLAATALTLDLAGFVRGNDPAVAGGWTGALPGLALAIPGALLLWQRPRQPIALILLAAGVLWTADGLASAWVNLAVETPGGLPGTALAFWLFERFGAWLLVALQLVLVLFPDGRPPRGRWRVVAYASIMATSLMPLALLLAPTDELIEASDPLDPRLAPFLVSPVELTLTPGVWAIAIPIARLGFPLGFVLALAVIAHRRSGADDIRRAQLRWLLWGATAAALGLLSWFVVPQTPANLLSTLGIAAFSASILIAITRYRLYEIDGLIGWTLISVLLAVAFFAVDAALLALLGVSGPAGPVAAVSALGVAALYLPLRERVRRVVRRIVSGRREEPFEVLLDLVDRLEAAESVEAQLSAIADTAREAFLTPRAVLELHRAAAEPVVVDRGDPQAVLSESYPVEYQGRQLAVLRMASPRRPRLSRNDRRLLDGLLGYALWAIRLREAHEELNIARTRLVTSREDERLRMRRELHDGIGPLLASVALRLDAVSARLEGAGTDPTALELVAVAADDASHAVDEVRRVAHGLRPAALTELGLRSAIEQQCARLSTGSLRITARLELPPSLPAAVEVAAYRIVSEAMTNVARHSGASRAEADLAVTGQVLRVVVDDDGTGITGNVLGHGLASQRVRAEELGGTWRIAPSALGGTRVVAEIPLGAEPDSETWAGR